MKVSGGRIKTIKRKRKRMIRKVKGQEKRSKNGGKNTFTKKKYIWKADVECRKGV